ncbi:MAG TPA: O-antigen ligase family protein [Cyclobacteriaceae bacterium]|nr:O-antigen ligase family protein [Cyclobacteriaceae bacterium]
MYKRDIINFLFLISFPMFGIGNYVSSSISPTIGYFIGSIPFLLITVFYLLDVLYGNRFSLKVGRFYYVALAYVLSGVFSLFLSWFKGLPDLSLSSVIGKSMLVFLPFSAFVIFYLYNAKSKEGFMPKLLFMSLTLLLIVNLLGYGAGLTNQGHNLEGRLNLPFFGGLYTAASVLAMMNLMLVFKMRKVWWTNPVRMFGYVTYFALNAVFIYFINSRLTMMILIAVILLIFLGGIRSNLNYWTSLFMIPLLLNGSILVYQILTLPVFASVMQRVDYENVTSFSGRSYLWEIGLAWMFEDQRGIVFGNGYQGQYFLGNLREIAALWNPETPDKMHFHSSSLEIIVNQGIVGLGLFLIIGYRVFKHYKERFIKDQPDGIIFFVVVYLLYDLQVSTFVYLDSLGSLFMMLFAAGIIVQKKSSTTQEVPSELVKVEDFA